MPFKTNIVITGNSMLEPYKISQLVGFRATVPLVEVWQIAHPGQGRCSAFLNELSETLPWDTNCKWKILIVWR